MICVLIFRYIYLSSYKNEICFYCGKKVMVDMYQFIFVKQNDLCLVICVDIVIRIIIYILFVEVKIRRNFFKDIFNYEDNIFEFFCVLFDIIYKYYVNKIVVLNYYFYDYLLDIWIKKCFKF